MLAAIGRLARALKMAHVTRPWVAYVGPFPYPHGAAAARRVLGVAESLAQMSPGDALIVCSVAPYTRMVADVARAAAAAGVHVIAITDTRASPLAPPARHAFFIPHESSFISNSMGAYVVFCEGLINLVAREPGDKALQALARREGFIEGLGIETG